MRESKRTYTREFKLEALRLWQTTDRSGAEIERELGIGNGCFSRWKQKYLGDGEGECIIVPIRAATRPDRCVFLHRRLLQPEWPAFVVGLSQPGSLREPLS